MRKSLLLLATLLLLALQPASAAAYLPPGFIGISPQGPTSAEDFALMEEAGIRSVRLPMYWASIQPENPSVEKPNFSGFDRSVEMAAEHGMRVFPFLWDSPSWAAPGPGVEPVESAWQRWGWESFLRAAVGRYGPEGSFWEEHPELPFLPIRHWEIWNEENIVTFANHPNPVQFAKLVRISGQVLHSADPGSKVILGGLFGLPLQVPPNVRAGNFLTRFYRTQRVKQYFDGIALHPYVADASAMAPQIENLRRIMRVHHDSSTPLYITELGWGSASGESRWERGLYGQADELDRAFSMLSAERLRWRIGGVWWFSWADENNACQFCDSAGLLTKSREAKPSWYSFNAWTGGDPETVPRASFPFG